MIFLDANYILRFLLKDNIEMYNEVEKYLLNDECYIPNEVMAEVVYVLLKVYNVPRDEIEKSLIAFLEFSNISMLNKEAMKEALKIFKNKNLDFVDAILCEASTRYTIKTFDKKLLKCIENK